MVREVRRKITLVLVCTFGNFYKKHKMEVNYGA
jgi:hypothetical protein